MCVNSSKNVETGDLVNDLPDMCVVNVMAIRACECVIVGQMVPVPAP